MYESDNDIYKYVSRKTFFASLLMVCAFSFLCMLTALNATKGRAFLSHSEYVPAVTEAANAFILRSVDGRLAVCSRADGSFIEALDIELRHMTDEELALLDNGIYVGSISELIAAIENYSH